MHHPDLAVRQLEYAVQELGLRGFSLGTSVQGRPLVPRVLSWFTVGWLGSLGYGESTSPAIGLT